MRALRVIPIVVVLLLVRTGWHLIADADTRVSDGVLTFGREDWFISLVLGFGWTVAVLTAVAVLDGGPRPLHRARRALPVALLGVAAYVAPLIICGFLAGTLLPGEPAVVVFVVTLVAIILIGVATNFALSATVAVIEQTGFAAFTTYAELRGKRWDMGVLLAVGVVAPVVALGLPDRFLHPGSAPTGLAVSLLLTLLAAIGVVVPAITLLEIYRRTRIIPELAPPAADRPNSPVLVGMAVLLLLPTAVAGAIVSSHRVTEVSHVVRSEATSIAAAWPPGRHPVLVTSSAIEDCLDDRCSATRLTQVGILVSNTSVAVRADGTVALLSDARLIVCSPDRVCTDAPKNGYVDLLNQARATAVIAPETGGILLAEATPAGTGQSRKLTVLRCQDQACRTTTPIELGVTSARSTDGRTEEMISGAIDGQGRLFVVYRDANGLGFLAWCVRPDCAETRLIEQGAPAEGAPVFADLLRAPRVPGVPLCSFSACRGLTPPIVAARPGGDFYAVVTEPAGSDEVDVYLVRCPDPNCERYVHVTTVHRDFRVSWSGDPLALGISDPARQDERWMITVAADGRVLLIQPHASPSMLVTVDPA